MAQYHKGLRRAIAMPGRMWVSGKRFWGRVLVCGRGRDGAVMWPSSVRG